MIFLFRWDGIGDHLICEQSGLIDKYLKKNKKIILISPTNLKIFSKYSDKKNFFIYRIKNKIILNIAVFFLRVVFFWCKFICIQLNLPKNLSFIYSFFYETVIYSELRNKNICELRTSIPIQKSQYELYIDKYNITERKNIRTPKKKLNTKSDILIIVRNSNRSHDFLPHQLILKIINKFSNDVSNVFYADLISDFNYFKNKSYILIGVESGPFHRLVERASEAYLYQGGGFKDLFVRQYSNLKIFKFDLECESCGYRCDQEIKYNCTNYLNLPNNLV
tara:strand:- start:3231 stop:4064 length:834 start_codon:yes stop_codon:yes gene_type:complete